jgi:Tfp pilus assembly protein PilP
VRLTAALAFVVLFSVPAWAQEKLPLGTHVGSIAAPTIPIAPSSGYEAEGRDPFVSLLVSKKTTAAAAKPGKPRPGLPGVALADISVKGIVHNGPNIMAVLEGPGGRSFVARANDHLQDATIKSIDAEAVVFSQRVVDPTGTAHTREIRKPLRQTLIEEEEDR